MGKLNKNIVAFFLFIFGVLCLAGVAYAFFSSTATSSNNSLSTGSLGVALGDDNEANVTNITTSWTASGMMPGGQLPQKKIIIYNSGSENANHLDIKFSYTGNADVAKNIVFSNINNGFRYGTNTDSSAVNLISALLGGTDAEYIVKQGSNGQAFTPTTVDGVDGTTPDGKISLAELAAFGKIRISPGTFHNGIYGNSNAEFWINAEVLTGLTAQNASVDVTMTFTLDQDASQF